MIVPTALVRLLAVIAGGATAALVMRALGGQDAKQVRDGGTGGGAGDRGGRVVPHRAQPHWPGSVDRHVVETPRDVDGRVGADTGRGQPDPGSSVGAGAKLDDAAPQAAPEDEERAIPEEQEAPEEPEGPEVTHE